MKIHLKKMTVEGGIVYLLMVLNVNAYAKLFLNVPYAKINIVLVLMRVYRPSAYCNKTNLNTNGWIFSVNE